MKNVNVHETRQDWDVTIRHADGSGIVIERRKLLSRTPAEALERGQRGWEGLISSGAVVSEIMPVMKGEQD